MTSTTMASDLAREALEPLAKLPLGAEVYDDVDLALYQNAGRAITVGDVRRARTAYDAIGSGAAQTEWLKARLADLQLPANRHHRREEWLLECGMPGLSAHTAAEAGPVGEAVGVPVAFEFEWLPYGEWERGVSLRDPRVSVTSQRYRNVRPLYARPVEEPGAVERQGLARIDHVHERAFNDGYRHGNAVASARAETAEAALAKTRERLEKLGAENAARLERAIRDAAISWCGEKGRETFPEDIAYFENNWRSLPGLRKHVALYLGHAALTGNAQEAGE